MDYCLKSRSVDIDSMDFTPRWYLNHKHTVSISEDECLFFGAMWWYQVTKHSSASREYTHKLVVYYERFNNHMPVEVRKLSLNQMVKDYPLDTQVSE